MKAVIKTAGIQIRKEIFMKRAHLCIILLVVFVFSVFLSGCYSCHECYSYTHDDSECPMLNPPPPSPPAPAPEPEPEPELEPEPEPEPEEEEWPAMPEIPEYPTTQKELDSIERRAD